MAISGRFKPLNPHKYAGDIHKIQFRSQWEFKVMRFLDNHPDVVWWHSEETVIPYICKTDGKPHRYFMDFTVKFKNKPIMLIEVKPKKETIPPVKKNQRQKTYLNEVFTYAKNDSKWQATDLFAKERGYLFHIWTEETLRKLGLKI